MLDDPRVNFAISARGHAAGINHLGLQVDSSDELAALRAQADSADLNVVDEKGAACCYAKSDKHWVRDPQGIAWETFHSLSSIPLFGEDAAPAGMEQPCCVPLAQQANDKADAACCVPAAKAAEPARSACCG
jgi:hypothetical protein